MTSGRWDRLTGRVRPGTYINVDGVREDSAAFGTRGIVLIPLINFGWGKDGDVLTITKENIGVNVPELGGTPGSVLLIGEALKGAATCKVYIINKGTKALASVTLKDESGEDPAVVLSATAKYGGTRGNALKVSCAAETGGTFSVTVFLGEDQVESFEKLATVADLIGAGSRYIDFACDTEDQALIAFAGTNLSGGTDGTATNADIAAMLDVAESIKWNTMAFPVEDAALQTAVISKIEYMRESIGKSVQAVLPNASASTADYEGIINLVNGVALEDGTELPAAKATAFVAAVTASADETKSNTYAVYPGADTVLNPLTNEAIENAILQGQMCFSYDDNGHPHIEYDINSRHTFTETRPKEYRKNKIIRVIDVISDTIRSTFPPNAFPNNTIGWDRIDSLGKTILQRFDENGGNGAIRNVDYDGDFLVDREKSGGDSVYVDVAITPVDAAEKLYFTVLTR